MSDPIDWQGRRQHGTRSSYSGGCRCHPCREAQAEANRYYDRRKVQEQWGAVPPLLVDSEPSRRHVQALMAGGMGQRRIAEESGVALTVIQRLMGWCTSRPAKKVHPETEAKLFACNPFALADGALIPAGPAARKVRALIAIGWPRLAQAKHLGMRQSNFHYADWDDSYTITVRRDRDIDAMYRQLCMTPGRSVRARNEAQRKSWPPPLAWDDIDAGTLADTEEGAGCTRCDDIEHLLPFESPVHIATRLGYTSPTIAQHLRRHGRPDLAARFERTNQKESA